MIRQRQRCKGCSQKDSFEQEKEKVLPGIEEDLVGKEEAYWMMLKVDRLKDILLYYYDVPKKESRQWKKAAYVAFIKEKEDKQSHTGELGEQAASHRDNT